MGKFSELDADRQTIERLRAPASLSAPCGNVGIIGKLIPAPDNRANRAQAHRRRAMATADRHEREALAVQERIDRVVAAGRAS